MKSISAVVFGLFAAVLTLAGCERAQAVEIGVGYVDSKIIGVDGASFKVGSEKSGVRYGLTTMVTKDRAENFGVYVGVPFRLKSVQLEFTPTLTTEYYREAGETVGGVGMNIGYRINESLVLESQGMINRSFNNSDFKGETYTIGLTKTF